MERTTELAIIGGSGLYAMEGFELLEKREAATPFGKPSSPLHFGKLEGLPVVFLARHGEGHVFNPSEVNYRANIWTLKSAGVKAVFSVSAVGSLKESIAPGHMAVIDQFFDRTKSLRASTFFEHGVVAHVGFGRPVSGYLRRLLVEACRHEGITAHDGGVYVCLEGPQFSTRAESEFYRSIGASVVGMTNLTEAKLAREAEMDYATLALATDYDCWHAGHSAVTAEQVLEVLRKNVHNARRVISAAVKAFDPKGPLENQNALQNAIFTDLRRLPPPIGERLRPIIGRYLKEGDG